MRFAHPLWLFCVWSSAVALGLHGLGHLRRTRLLRAYATRRALGLIAPHRSSGRRWAKAALVALSLLALSVALSGPQYGHRWQEVERKGVDLIVALDCSRSMLAEDLKPNRLERAKRKVMDLLNRLEGDRIGLVAFAGTAFLQCPLTLDYSGFHLFLQALSPDFLPVGGTAIAEALDVAREGFDPKSPAEKALVLITDGEETQGDLETAAERARQAGIRVFAIGVGSGEGAPIPQPGGGFVKDASGGLVLARLGEEPLRTVAALTGGAYARSVSGDLDLELLYDREIREGMEAKTLEAGRVKVWEDRYQWPLAAAVAALLAALALPLRRRTAVAVVTALIVGTAAASAPAATSADLVRQGLEAYGREDYDAALDLFAKAQVQAPDAPEIAYDLGNAYYKKADYDKALSSYASALKNATPDLKPRILYNLGNAAFRAGKPEEALKGYQAALAADPKDEDARLNLEYVRRQLERQEKQSEGGPNKPRGEPKEDPGESRAQDQQKASTEQEKEAGGDPKPEDRKEHAGEDQKQQEDSSSEKRDAGTSSPETKEGEAPSRTEERQGREDSEKQGRDNSIDRQQAASVLNRLRDQPGKALLPSYQKRRVEKDW